MSEYQEKAKDCKCCTKHVPLPTTFKEYSGLVLCPTTYYNVIEYKRIWDLHGSRPAGNLRKHFSEYVQGIVEKQIENDTN
jgi:hypothetical protein